MAEKLSINIGLVKASQRQADSVLLTDLNSPLVPSAKRRKSKIINRKNNQEHIQQAYKELMNYVDSVDNRVQQIVQTHQGQFLQAYKQHVKRLREEMQDIKRRSLNNSNSQKVHLEKIDVLEKQLVIFREESLKLFDRIIKKDKQIDDLQRKINTLQKDQKEQEIRIYDLAKNKKVLQVQLQRTKTKLEGYEVKYQNQQKKHSRQFSIEQKRKSQILTPLTKQAYGHFNDHRPYTTNLKSQRSKNLSLRLQSSGKVENKQFQDLAWLKKQLEQKIGDQKKVQIQTVLNLLAENKRADFTSLRGTSHDYSSARKKLKMKIETNRNKFISQTSSLKINENRNENQLKDIFKNCVQEVRKDIMKRKNIPSLNFFKENGPKSYIQFKKIDHFNLLQILFKDQKVMKNLYQIIFGQSHT